jgi:hypothetical protein
MKRDADVALAVGDPRIGGPLSPGKKSPTLGQPIRNIPL